MQCHPFLTELCEVMIYGSTDYPLFSDGFSAEDKKNALAHLKSLESFSFIYSLVVLYHVLPYFKEPMTLLQGISKDLTSGLKLIKECQQELVAIRSDAHQLAKFSDRIYAHSCRLAERCGITPSMPRICSRQQHRSNIQCDAGAKEYF